MSYLWPLIFFLSACVSIPPAETPKPKTAILIGDSHSDYFDNGTPPGFGFFSYRLQQLIPELAVYAVSGSTPDTWVTGKLPDGRADPHFGCTLAGPGLKTKGCATIPKASSLPAADLCVIEQGTNMLGMSSMKVAMQVLALTGAVKCGRGYWVGAPSARLTLHPLKQQDDLESAVKAALPAAWTYIPSRWFTYKPDHNNDGEHLDPALAGTWAESVAKTVLK